MIMIFDKGAVGEKRGVTPYSYISNENYDISLIEYIVRGYCHTIVNNSGFM
jgi:hypothetical protein